MSVMIAIWTTLALGLGVAPEPLPQPGDLRQVSILPGSSLESALVEVVLSVEGLVETREYVLEGPSRLVVELVGARQGVESRDFRGVNRGGVRSVRTERLSAEVVRVELELDLLEGYAIRSGDGYVRISLRNPYGDFDPWTGEIASPQPSPSAAPAAEARTQSTSDSWGGLTRQPTSRRMSVTFVEHPIREVLFTFAEFAGKSIVAGTGVTGNISAEIRDQPWDVALQAILEANNLAAMELQSGIIRVDRLRDIQERVEVEPLQTRIFRISFAPAGELETSVRSLLSSRGQVSVSRGTNTLVVSDVGPVLDQVAALIEGIDVQTPEITISAKIIFVNRSDLEEFGVVYDLKDSRGNQINRIFPGGSDFDGDGFISPSERVPIGSNSISFGGNSIAAIGNANQRVSTPAAQFLTSLVLGRHTLLSFVEALQQVNFSDIQAHPQVRVMENQTANILVGERVPIPVTQQTATTGGGGTNQDNRALFQPFTVQLLEVGIKLEVTPQVAAGNLILMDVAAERSGFVQVESTLGYIFNTQEAKTRVLVEDGETVVVGGLTVTETTEFRSGIPILMNLPVLGRLFRVTRENKAQRDLIIMITPQINRR
jgi:type IV pilus assembly protein PilQ